MSLLRSLLCLITLSAIACPVLAIDESDLLPVDQAFALTAEATTRTQVTLRWKIATGYYLYRHRISVVSDSPDFTVDTLSLPDGDKHQDEFFGAVETYRHNLNTQLAGQAAASATQISLKVKYQGCADTGICYPPQQRTLTVDLPTEGDANLASGGNALGDNLLRGLPGANPVLPMSAQSGVPGMDSSALPAARAFQVDAIALDGNQLLLRLTPAPGYYIYRDKTTLALKNAEGIELLTAQPHSGTLHRDEHFGEVQVYFHQVEIPIPLARTTTAAHEATLQVEFQGCQKDGICYPPMQREVEVSIPAGHVSTKSERQAALATHPAVDIATSGGATQVQVPRTRPPQDVLAKVQPSGNALIWALLLALAGGLVLNLMPCVLPVLSLKALSLAGGNHKGAARRHALAYTAGVLLGFLALGGLVIGLRGAGLALGWGFQLQQPWVVALLAYVMFAVGLNLSGVFGIGYGLAGAGHQLTVRNGLSGDFFTGVLAVVVASPCTAPFMATALAYAFTASLPAALLVFLMLGLDLALPFLLIGFIPGLANRLPRPGAWMDTLKQLLAFPMYLTAAWLVWVLGQQRGVDAIGAALAGAVVLGLVLWWWQRLQLRTAPAQRIMVVLVLMVSLLPLGWIARQPPVAARASADGTVEYSAKALADLRAQQRIVLVDMTADWCVTCKANEKAVLNTDAFRTSLKAHNAVLMTGDWTNVDPEISRFLERHQAVGVPLYVVFPRDGGEGKVLPTVLTHAIVASALKQADTP